MTQGELAAPQMRKLRLGVMGEFSAGKSTLCNLLLGARPLTERVTATRLSPVWISKGPAGLEREFLDGSREPVAFADLETVPIKDTRSIRLYDEADVLDMFDLVDFPGISDPNMPTEVWERLVPEIDAVLWCTHANQAWRQSEAEVWRAMPQDVKARSLLLVTRYDTIPGESDKARMLARVRHETAGQFAGIFPISLTQALASQDDPEGWADSGAEPFIAHLVDVITEMQAALDEGYLAARAPQYEPMKAREAEPPAEGAAVPASDQDIAPAGDAAPMSMPDVAQMEDISGMDAEPVHAETPGSVQEALGGTNVMDDEVAPMEATEVTDAREAIGPDDAEAPRPASKSPISLLSRRSSAPQETPAPAAVLPRRVTSEGSRRTERPRGDAAVRAMQIDEPTREDAPPSGDLRSAFSPR